MHPEHSGVGNSADLDELSIPLPAPAGETRLLLRLRRIPPGAFRMGTRGGEINEEPVHRVEVPYEYWLGTFVVTQAEYAYVVLGLGLDGQARSDGKNWEVSPSFFHERERHPVENVAWIDAAGHRACVRLGTVLELDPCT